MHKEGSARSAVGNPRGPRPHYRSKDLYRQTYLEYPLSYTGLIVVDSPETETTTHTAVAEWFLEVGRESGSPDSSAGVMTRGAGLLFAGRW